jgi:hypothetical protein
VPLATGTYKASLLDLASPHTFCLFSSGMSDDGTVAVSHKQHHGLIPFSEHLSGVREPTPLQRDVAIAHTSLHCSVSAAGD